jgi:hypothetical protein
MKSFNSHLLTYSDVESRELDIPPKMPVEATVPLTGAAYHN